jgi:hypothetical protein
MTSDLALIIFGSVISFLPFLIQFVIFLFHCNCRSRLVLPKSYSGCCYFNKLQKFTSIKEFSPNLTALIIIPRSTHVIREILAFFCCGLLLGIVIFWNFISWYAFNNNQVSSYDIYVLIFLMPFLSTCCLLVFNGITSLQEIIWLHDKKKNTLQLYCRTFFSCSFSRDKILVTKEGNKRRYYDKLEVNKITRISSLDRYGSKIICHYKSSSRKMVKIDMHSTSYESWFYPNYVPTSEISELQNYLSSLVIKENVPKLELVRII